MLANRLVIVFSASLFAWQNMNAIEFDSVTKTFPGGSVAVNNLSFEVGEGETVALVGPSGSGKTTTLRLLAGLDRPTDGSIRLGGRNVTSLPPAERNIALLFQSDALYPHMSVRNNLSFGLKSRRSFFERIPGFRVVKSHGFSGGIENRVRDVAKRLSIGKLLDRKPHQLSGGERQRVALGRAIVRNPAAFLLDEPLSKLDARLADELRIELRQVFRELGKPVLYVTHDQQEAMTLAQRIVVVDQGRIVQIGKPLEIYQRPANLFVANFMGSVPLNVSSSRLFPGASSNAQSVGFRAEHLEIEIENGHQPLGDEAVGFRAAVREVIWLGDHQLVHLDVRDWEKSWVARGDASVDFSLDQPVFVSVKKERLMWFDASERRIEVAY